MAYKMVRKRFKTWDAAYKYGNAFKKRNPNIYAGMQQIHAQRRQTAAQPQPATPPQQQPAQQMPRQPVGRSVAQPAAQSAAPSAALSAPAKASEAATR